MSQFALRLPDSLHAYAKDVAREDHTSLNQFIVTAVAEKISALKTADFFRQHAAGADPARVAEILAKVPDAPPLPGDEIE
jgi:hypothetical protein